MAGNEKCEKVMAMKNIAKQQKAEICKTDMNWQIRLHSQNHLKKMTRETRELKTTRRDLRMYIIEKEESINENAQEIIDIKEGKKKHP